MSYEYRDPLRLVCDWCGKKSIWHTEGAILPVTDGTLRPKEWYTTYQKLERHDFCSMAHLMAFEKDFYRKDSGGKP